MRRLALSYGLYDSAIPYEAECLFGLPTMIDMPESTTPSSSFMGGQYVDPSFTRAPPKFRVASALLHAYPSLRLGMWDIDYMTSRGEIAQHILYLRYATLFLTLEKECKRIKEHASLRAATP